MKSEIIICECGASFTWEPQDEWALKYLRPEHCFECIERIAAEREAAERQKHIAEVSHRARMSTHDATPAIFRVTDTKHPKFNVNGWHKLRNWRPSADKPWLGLVGETGSCKTRIAYMVASEEIERMALNMGRQPSFKFVAAYEISDMVGQLIASSFETKDEARADLVLLRNARLLLIDDLGKGRLSPAVASELFALIDHRYCHALPTIWTANSTPEAIAAALPDDMAAPFAGRLNDLSRIIRFK